MSEQKRPSIKVLTPEFRVSFPSVFEKKAPMAGSGGEPKYEITMLFPKTTDLKALKDAAMKEAVALFGPKDKWPESFKWPFKDGDKKQDQKGYAGHIYLKATSTQPVGVLNKDKTPLTKEDGLFYAGCYARATLNVKAYNKGGGKGVTFYLNNVIKTKDGEAFSARKSAEDDFASLEIESDGSDNPENYSDDDMWN